MRALTVELGAHPCYRLGTCTVVGEGYCAGNTLPGQVDSISLQLDFDHKTHILNNAHQTLTQYTCVVNSRAKRISS